MEGWRDGWMGGGVDGRRGRGRGWSRWPGGHTVPWVVSGRVEVVVVVVVVGIGVVVRASGWGKKNKEINDTQRNE